jgi:hypothetical protein
MSTLLRREKIANHPSQTLRDRGLERLRQAAQATQEGDSTTVKLALGFARGFLKQEEFEDLSRQVALEYLRKADKAARAGDSTSLDKFLASARCLVDANELEVLRLQGNLCFTLSRSVDARVAEVDPRRYSCGFADVGLG